MYFCGVSLKVVGCNRILRLCPSSAYFGVRDDDWNLVMREFLDSFGSNRGAHDMKATISGDGTLKIKVFTGMTDKCLSQ